MAVSRIPGWTIRALVSVLVGVSAVQGWCDDSAASPAAGGDSFYRLTGSVPAGFEELAAPQRGLIDVYFGQQRITRQMATYTPETISFDHPDAIVAALPESADPGLLRQDLAGSLPGHGDRLCRYSSDDGCGALEPATVAVLFDQAGFRADVFVNSRLLVAQPVVAERYLPPADSGFSVLQNVMTTAAGSEQTGAMFYLGSFTTIAYDDTRLVGEASYTDDESLTFDRLFVQRDRERFEYAGGLFRTSGRAFSFSGEQQLGGARFASTLNTRTDLGLAYGTPIALSLASRARVDLIKDGRLVNSRFYDAGNQMVDTSMLPEGAYDLLIRITEGGATREETRFFSKSSRLPPLDQPLYQVEAGALLERTADGLLPEDTGEWLARFGHSRRLTQTFGVDGGIAATGTDQLFELGVFQMDALAALGAGTDAFYEVQAAAFVGSGSSRGVSLSGQLRFGSIYAGLDARSVTSDRQYEGAFVDPELAPEPFGIDNAALIPPSVYQSRATLIPQPLDQANLTVQFPFLGGVAGIIASEVRRDGVEDVSRQSLTFRRSLLRTRPGALELRADLNFESDKVQALVGVRLHLRRDRWSGEVTPRYRYDDLRPNGDSPHGYQVDAATHWSDPDFAGGELRLATNAAVQRDVDTFGAAADFNNRFAQTRVSVDRFQGPEFEDTSWAGTVFTSVLGDGDQWAVGGQNTSDAAILVTLEGRSPDTEFDVLVDGYSRGSARGGATTALHLPAYRTYEVRVRPRRSAFVQFDDSVRAVTLYPGNVVRLEWEVKSLFVVLGRVVDADGAGIANATINGVQGMAATDAEGFFQAEVSAAGEVVDLEFQTAAGRCSVSAPIIEQRQGVAFLETLTCSPAGGLARVD